MSSEVLRVADQSKVCLDIILNFVVAEYTQAPPLPLPSHAPFQERDSLSLAQERATCLNMAVNAFGSMPLLWTHLRMDPVLYQDNVSMLRKEYRKMERRTP